MQLNIGGKLMGLTTEQKQADDKRYWHVEGVENEKGEFELKITLGKKIFDDIKQKADVPNKDEKVNLIASLNMTALTSFCQHILFQSKNWMNFFERACSIHELVTASIKTAEKTIESQLNEKELH